MVFVVGVLLAVGDGEEGGALTAAVKKLSSFSLRCSGSSSFSRACSMSLLMAAIRASGGGGRVGGGEEEGFGTQWPVMVTCWVSPPFCFTVKDSA